MKISIDTTELKTIDQSSTLLNKTRMTIYRWLKDERIIGIRIGGKTFIPQAEIDRILKGDTNLTKAMNEGKV